MFKLVKYVYRITLNNKLFFKKKHYKDYDYCKYCNGFKIIRCLECYGSGRIFYDGMKEHLCNTCCGRGDVVCDFCGGIGCDNTIF